MCHLLAWLSLQLFRSLALMQPSSLLRPWCVPAGCGSYSTTISHTRSLQRPATHNLCCCCCFCYLLHCLSCRLRHLLCLTSSSISRCMGLGKAIWWYLTPREVLEPCNSARIHVYIVLIQVVQLSDCHYQGHAVEVGCCWLSGPRMHAVHGSTFRILSLHAHAQLLSCNG